MKPLKNFLRCNKASTTLVMAVAFASVIIGVLVATIDMNKGYYASNINQNALDTAALSTAQYLEKMNSLTAKPSDRDDKAKLYAKTMYKSSLNSHGTFSQLETTAPGIENFEAFILNDKVVLRACLQVFNSFNKPTSQKACNKSAASFGGADPIPGNVETVFALDVSASMEAKFPIVATAVNNIVNEYKSENNYWGLVPYKGMVNIEPYAADFVKDDLSEMDASVPTGTEGFKVMNAHEKKMVFPTDPITTVYGVTARHPRISKFDVRGSMSLPLTEESSKVGFEKGYSNDSLYDLMNIPITERINGTTTFTDDPPVAGPGPATDTRFKAYWHHDKKITFGITHEYTPGQVSPVLGTNVKCGRYIGGNGSGGSGGSGG